MHSQCTHSELTMHSQQTRSVLTKHSHSRCTRSASIVHSNCIRSALTVRSQCALSLLVAEPPQGSRDAVRSSSACSHRLTTVGAAFSDPHAGLLVRVPTGLATQSPTHAAQCTAELNKVALGRFPIAEPPQTFVNGQHSRTRRASATMSSHRCRITAPLGLELKDPNGVVEHSAQRNCLSAPNRECTKGCKIDGTYNTSSMHS